MFNLEHMFQVKHVNEALSCHMFQVQHVNEALSWPLFLSSPVTHVANGSVHLSQTGSRIRKRQSRAHFLFARIGNCLLP